MNETTQNIISISLSRNIIPLIGLSIYTQNEILLYDFTDMPSLKILISQINIYAPCTLLIPDTQIILLTILKKHFDYDIIKLPREYFEDETGKFLGNCDFISKIRNKYFVATSLNAILKFINVTILPSKLFYKNIENYCFMTTDTATSLELITSNDNGKSLFDIINNTKTPMGKRRLKTNLIQPFYNSENIENRHKLIKILNDASDLSAKISYCLESFVDIDNLVIDTTTINSNNFEEQIKIVTNVFKIKDLFDAFVKLKELVENETLQEHDLINIIKEQIQLDLFTEINNELENVFSFDVHKQDLNKFRSNPILLVININDKLDPFLNISIKIFYEVKNDIENEIEKLEKSLGFVFETVYDWNHGFLLKIKNKDFENLKSNESISKLKEHSKNTNLDINSENTNKMFTTEFRTDSIKEDSCKLNYNLSSCNQSEVIIVENETFYVSESKIKNCNKQEFIILKKQQEMLFISTIDIMKLNSRIKTSLEQIIQILHIPCIDVLQKFQQKSKFFFDISDNISELDIINSLYIYGIQDPSILPEICDSILISNSSHPLFDKYNRINNNIYASPKLHYNIITGCNMNGKTVYAKSVALNIILAQIGSPICADYAKIKLFNKILTRLKHDNTIEERLSTYEYELYEIKNIIESADKDTLIIIDELGRGSTYYNGTTIALLTCQELLLKGSYVFFITHFIEIIEYIKFHTNVNILKCANYSVISGICMNTQGIELCKDYFPVRIIEDAILIKKKLANRTKNIIFENSKIQLALMIMESNENEMKSLKEKMKEIVVNKKT